MKYPHARLLKPAAVAIRLSLCALGAVTLPGVVCAAETAATQYYSIPAGSLTAALSAFASASGNALSFDAALVQGRQSGGLDGTYSVAQGFALLLKGSGLQAVPQSNGSYALRPLHNEAGTMELDATTISSQRLDPTSEGTNAYAAQAVTIGKGVHSLRETPQAVSVLTRKYMDDQNINTVDQAMEKTPGIVAYESPMGGKYFYSRGFMMQGQYQYDGVPLDVGGEYVQANSFSGDMALYDRVEVLKGAAGMLKGSGSSTGGVNFVRKRGQATPTTSINLSAGSWDNYRGQVDTGGPLNESGTLRGRAVVALQDRQYFYDVAKRNDQILYGALDYDATPDTTVGLGVAYERLDATPCWHGLPRYSNGKDLKLSRSTCLGASWNNWESERTTVFADLAHRLNDDWSFKFALSLIHI